MSHFTFYRCTFTSGMRFRGLVEGSSPLRHLISFFLTSDVCFQGNFSAFPDAQEKKTRVLKGENGNKHEEWESTNFYRM